MDGSLGGRLVRSRDDRLGLLRLREDLVDTLLGLELLLDVGDQRSGRTGLAGAGDDLDDAPALRRAERAALLDAHEVARKDVAVLAVRREALPDAERLAVQRVLAHALDLDDDRLRHLRGDDHADLRAAARLRCGATRGLTGCGRRGLAADR